MLSSRPDDDDEDNDDFVYTSHLAENALTKNNKVVPFVLFLVGCKLENQDFNKIVLYVHL